MFFYVGAKTNPRLLNAEAAAASYTKKKMFNEVFAEMQTWRK